MPTLLEERREEKKKKMGKEKKETQHTSWFQNTQHDRQASRPIPQTV